MKYYLLILTLIFTVKSEGQTELQSILKNSIKVSLPYTSISKNINLEKTKKILNSTDSLFVVTKLNQKEPKTINRYGDDSSFGRMDCEETANNPGIVEINNCLKISEMKEIAILCYIKINEYQYLLHIELTEKDGWGESKGILVSVNGNGDVLDWFFSDGSTTGGNPNGNVSRDFTVQKNLNVDVEETSWGNNNVSYLFKAKYEIVQNSEKNSDFKNGEFKLKNLNIKY